ncbi:MAG: hypothetical protein Q8M02_03975 [Candidatus Didemnitutus sp.]|nr:hypothetical protein [Candidatus Didemnitutus sp.]
MNQIAKWIAVALALVVGAVAAVFGVVIVAVLMLLAAVFALFGKGSFKVNINRGPAQRRQPAPPPVDKSDAIDVEATKVEPPPHELR